MRHQSGYTLVELMVALAVTSIVLAGTYAAYAFFAQQQQSLLLQTEVDRGALRVIDLMQSDIRMAGYKDYADPDPMPASQAIKITNPDDVSFVYDDFDANGALYRTLVRYSVVSHVSAQSGLTRQRLKRDVRRCIDPSVICTVTNSTSLVTADSDGAGEPILDWVTTFLVTGLNPRATGSFATQFQTVQVKLVVDAPQKIEGTTRKVTKTFTFLTRAKNVSLVP